MLERTDSISITEPASSQLRFSSTTNFDVNFIISFLFKIEYKYYISLSIHLLSDFQIDSTYPLLRIK